MSGIERTTIDSFEEIKIIKIKRDSTSHKMKFWEKALERIVGELSLVEGELMLTC